MSKIGKKLIEVPANVTVAIDKGGKYSNLLVKVSGPLGNLTQDIRKGINVELNNNNNIII